MSFFSSTCRLFVSDAVVGAKREGRWRLYATIQALTLSLLLFSPTSLAPAGFRSSILQARAMALLSLEPISCSALKLGITLLSLLVLTLSSRQDIQTCQARGKVILLSLGGAIGTYGFSSASEAQTFATTLWNTFGEGTSSTRPFGSSVVDGFDLGSLVTCSLTDFQILRIINHSFIPTLSRQCVSSSLPAQSNILSLALLSKIPRLNY